MCTCDLGFGRVGSRNQGAGLRPRTGKFRGDEDGGPQARRWAILEWCFAGLYARPPARRWAILEWCFTGLYAGLRPGAGQFWSGVSPGCTRHRGPGLETSGVTRTDGGGRKTEGGRRWTEREKAMFHAETRRRGELD